MTITVHNYLIGAPWSALLVRGDANLDPEDEANGPTGEGASS